jgi:TRAP-type C4-dicarboxylate transport system substrate-binding protein
MNITKSHISVGTLITVIPLVAGAALWYDGLKEAQHEAISQTLVASNVELDLQRVELELKLLRTIIERRALTPDEQDRLEYLKQLREVLIAEQRKKDA